MGEHKRVCVFTDGAPPYVSGENFRRPSYFLWPCARITSPQSTSVTDFDIAFNTVLSFLPISHAWPSEFNWRTRLLKIRTQARLRLSRAFAINPRTLNPSASRAPLLMRAIPENCQFSLLFSLLPSSFLSLETSRSRHNVFIILDDILYIYIYIYIYNHRNVVF